MPGDYIVVNFLTEQPAGSQFVRSRKGWPLHITLVPWFSGLQYIDIADELATCARSFLPFTVTFADELQFNPDTRVTVVEDVHAIGRLHNSLLAHVVDKGGVLRADRWLEGRFKAHVTQHPDATNPGPGDEARIESLSLVTLLTGNKCQVVRNFPFGHGDETAA